MAWVKPDSAAVVPGVRGPRRLPLPRRALVAAWERGRGPRVRADVVLAPSLGESFGNAVVEGQLARRPVVATAVQGHLETVVDGRTGLLVPCEDAAALADAVARLLDDEDLAVTIANRGHESASKNFSSPRYHQQIRTTVEELIGH